MGVFEGTLTTSSGKEAKTYRLTHRSGLSFTVMEYAAAITEVLVPDTNGSHIDVMIGFSDLDGYLQNGGCHGSVVGRVANRTKNAAFHLNGKKYNMPRNDGENNLHGGPGSFQNVFWDSRILTINEAQAYLDDSGIKHTFRIAGEAVLFSHISPDNTCGLPGELHATVLYAWSEDQTLIILYRGESDEDTLFCPTNHSYFNLQGYDSGNVAAHLLWIDASSMTNKSSDNVPDGSLSDIAGTVFDFSQTQSISQTMRMDDPQLVSSLGLDQNYCLHTDPYEVSLAACLYSPGADRKMEVLTNFPGLQVYTGNHTDNMAGKNGIIHERYAGVCLEAQLYPDAIHHDSFPDAVLRAGETKNYITGYRFGFSS